MSHRLATASFSLLLGTLLIATPTVAQDRHYPQQSASGLPGNPFDNSVPDGFSAGRITGTVHTFEGRAVSNARIEARDVGRGTIFVTALSDSSGSFALYNISPGTYDVTVSAGNDVTHERVEVESGSANSNVDIRVGNKPSEPASGPGGGETVSLSQYSVPAKARGLYEKAMQAMLHGKLDESRNKANAALAIYPKFPEALTLRGMIEAQVGKSTEAIADLQQAIHYDPNYAAACLALGSVYNSTGRFDDALLLLGEAERLAAKAWLVYFEVARADIGKGKFAEALRNIDRSSELQGGVEKEAPELHLVRGYALIGLTEMPQAAHELETFLAREPRGEVADRARIILDKLRATTVTASQ